MLLRATLALLGLLLAVAAPAAAREARPFVSIPGTDFLEGPSFDPSGRTLFLAGGEKLYRIDVRSRRVRTVLSRPGQRMASTARGPDGHLYVADLRAEAGDPAPAGGSIFSVRPDGSDRRTVVRAAPGDYVVPDDIGLRRRRQPLLV